MIPKKQHRLITTIVFVVAGIMALCAIVFGAFSFIQNKYASRLFPNVYINAESVANRNKSEIALQFSPIENKLQNVVVQITFNSTPIATLSAQTLHLHLNTDEAFEKAYIVGRSPYIPSRILQTLQSVFSWQKFEFPLEISYLKQPIIDAVSQVQDDYEKKPKDARFQFEAGKVTVFEKEENGLHIETTKTLLDIDKALKGEINNTQENKTPLVISIAQTVVKPDITLAQTNTFGIEELIAEGDSDYTHSIPQRIHNLLLATSKFNGVLIPKGATFSFNDTVGDISSSTGYQPAYIIKDGKTVLGDGGGVCQVSTTLFRAILNAGLPIVEYHPHAYRVGYYENDSKPGLDATVFGPTVDLKFTNNTPASILIQTVADEEHDKLAFKLYGKKDNRVVQLSTPIVSGISAPPDPLYQDDPTLKKGVTKQVDFAAWGAKVFYTYKVTKDSQEMFQKDFNISFRPWQAVYLVGTAD